MSIGNKDHLINDADSLRHFIHKSPVNDAYNEADPPLYQTMFQTLIEHAPIGIYIVENGAFSYVNSYYSTLLGYNEQELTQGTITLDKIIHPDDYPMVKRNIEKRALGDPKEARYRIRKFKKNGDLLYSEIHASVADIDGKVILFGSVADITEQVLAQQQLQENSEQYKSLFYNSPDGIFAFDQEGQFISANPAAELITGYSNSELLNMSFMPLIIPEDLPMAIEHFEQAKKGVSSSSDLIITRKDGQRVNLSVTHFPMKINGEIIGSYGIARDITQKMLYDKQMEQFAFYDPLTKLPNRKLFEDRLEQMMNFSKEGQIQFAVLFVNLDRFKFINDSLGHHLGDECLKMVSERLKENVSKPDTISRLAGDEFTILLSDTSQEEVIRLAAHINAVLMEAFHVEGHSVSLTASIGVVLSRGSEHSAEELIRNAGTAMYYTKKFKKNSYTIYSEEMDVRASYKLTLERDLKSAIENKELELYYQPIMDLKTARVTAMEALIRWHHPQLGLIPPSDFIPLAEDNGQVITIGAWVLETACRQGRIWQDSGITPFKIAVNISTKQLQQRQFVDSIVATLEATGFEAKWLELEITESILLDDVDLVKESLLKLKQAGISISIDDFGTGYTSLNYLRQYPFDKVKIDRSFIDDINRDLNGKTISSAIISLAHSLNMNVVAEGIENEIQLKYLEQERCDQGQGYFFSRPLPVHLIQLKLNS